MVVIDGSGRSTWVAHHRNVACATERDIGVL
jgi:hypothetical protein